MRRLLLTPALVLALTSCAASDPVAERREAVADVTDAANAGDAQSLRDAVDDLLSVLRAQVASGEVDRAEADRLRLLAERIAATADLVEPAPAPEPSPEPTEEAPSPEPTEEEPSPEQTEEEPSPEPTEEPQQTEAPEEPEETVAPVPEISIAPVETSPTPTPARMSQPKKASPTSAAASPEPTA